MRSRAWCRAARESAAPTSISPNQTVLKQSRSGARFLLRCSFDVLYLFAQLFNFRANFQGQRGDGERFALDSGCFGEHGVRFPVHFLKKEVELLSGLAGAIKQLSELLQMTAQAVEFLADVAALGQQRGFLSEARGLNARAAQQFLETRF